MLISLSQIFWSSAAKSIGTIVSRCGRPLRPSVVAISGTLPLTLVIVAEYWRSELLSKEMLACIMSMEATMSQLDKTLIALESRAGLIFLP